MLESENLLKELSILIVTWHGDEVLKNCLASLKRACGDHPEIVVVDNADEEQTRSLVQSYANAKYVTSPKNLGFAGGNNLGLGHCTRRYVLLLNNDTEIHQEPFSQLITYLKDHAEVGIVQGRMNRPLIGGLDACGFLLTVTGAIMERYTFMTLDKVPDAIVLAAKGACLMFDRKVLDDLDGVLFHDHFFNNHEETDFCHRAWLKGWKVAYVDTPAIDHLCNYTVKRMNKVEFFGQGLSNQMFSYLTLFGPRGLLTIIPAFLLVQSAIALRFLLIGDTAPVRTFALSFKRLWERRRLLTQTRTRVQKTRRISDSELFKQVIPPHTLRYSWLNIRGRAREFWE